MMSFGEVVAHLLRQRGWSQAEFSRVSGLSTGYIAQLVTGMIPNPTWSKACTIADALGVTLQEIRDLMEGRAPAE